MKKITLVVVSVLVSAFAFAGPDDPKSSSGMAVLKRDESSFKLVYKSELQSDVKVQIFNDKNDMIFSETIKKSSGFLRPYNFEGLPEGEYTIKLNNGSNWMTETINFNSAKAEKLAQLIRMADGKYLLTVAGKGEDKITVRVSDKAGETVHYESTPVYGDFAMVYDLGKLNDEFSFEISDQHGLSKTLRR